MDRAAFIESMKAALSVSEDLNAPPVDDIVAIAKKFDFDFPVLSTENLEALVKVLESEEGAFPLRLGAKFSENVNYLTQCKQASEEKAFARALSSFTTNIFLSQPERMLQMNRATLSRIFREENIGSGADESVTFPDLSQSHEDIIFWDKIFERFFLFLLTGSASLLFGVVADDESWCATTITKGNHMENLCKSLNQFGEILALVSDVQEDPAGNQNTENCTLLGALRYRARCCNLGVEGSCNFNSKKTQDKRFIDSLQKVWLHMTFLARDVVVQCPSLLERSLGDLLASIDSLSTDIDRFKNAGSGRLSDETYPSSRECLQALVCANIASALQNVSNTVVEASAGAREAFRRTICHEKGNNIGSSVTFGSLVVILERMGRLSTDGGAEACALLLDVSALFVDKRDARGRALRRWVDVEAMHQNLLSSRALPVLVDFLARFMGSEGASQAGKTPVTTQLIGFLSEASLQGPHTIASFLLRLPLFLPAIRAIVETWSSGVEGSTHAVTPADAIPLFLSLSLALTQNGSSPDPSHELVRALCGSVALTVERIQTASENHDPQDVKELIADDVNCDEKAKKDAELLVDRQMKAKQVPGLTTALQLLLSQDSTGRTAVSRAKDHTELHQALINLCTTLNAFSSRSDELRRLGKDFQAALEGHSSSKTD